MLVTCALKRRNGTHTKRNIFNGAFKTFEIPFLHLFTNWNIFCISVKKKQRLVDSVDLTMLFYYKVYYFRTLLAICFTLITLHLRDFRIPCNVTADVTKTRFC